MRRWAASVPFPSGQLLTQLLVMSTLQNMFKIEQDFEQASQDYEFHNTALKNELPRFFELATAFITPLFQSFYYMQRKPTCVHASLRRHVT